MSEPLSAHAFSGFRRETARFLAGLANNSDEAMWPIARWLMKEVTPCA